MWINLISVHPSAPLTISMYHVHWIPHVTICFIWIHPTIHLNTRHPSVESVEIELIDEFEESLESNRHPPTDIFHEHYGYDLFLLNQEIDTPSDNLNFQDTHGCENQDDTLIHATNLSHIFALPQFMAQHNYEDLKPTDTPSKVPIAIQASIDYPFNPWCAHNPMATQCNQSQYPNPNHNYALSQFMAQPNCEDLEPTDTPSTVQTTLQASCNQPSILSVLTT